jgi:GMP synthase (glutamine-hydrolysing)
VVPAREALDGALGAGTEDPVRVQVQRALQHAHRAVVVAGMQRAACRSRGRQRDRDEQRDEKMSKRGTHGGSGGARTHSRKALNLAIEKRLFAGSLAAAGMKGFVQMEIVVVEQQSDAPAGLVGEWALERGHTLRIVRVHASDPWPEAETVQRAVVLGSDRSVHDAPPEWVGEEIAWIRTLVAASRPVLGLCFGGQALAAAMGADVTRAAVPEIGWVDVSGEVAGTWFAWHFDTFSAPPGARELGRTQAALQGFAVGPHMGLQFHPEVTPAIVDDWISAGGRDLERQRLDAAAIRERTATEAERARVAAFALFDRWAS